MLCFQRPAFGARADFVNLGNFDLVVFDEPWKGFGETTNSSGY
jgi:hypothetical protein